MTFYYMLNNKKIKVECQKCGEGYHNLIPKQSI